VARIEDMRVVSLLPSATEMCYALGVEPVGVSHECDFPPAARRLPSVIDSRVDATATSEEIDRQTQAAVESGGVYELDRDTLAELDPDVVLSQGLCEVCAVDVTEVETAIEELGLDASVVRTDPDSFGAMLEDIERIGGQLDREATARTVRERLESRVADIERAVGNRSERPRVLVLDWLDPVMVAGHWMPGLVERAGGRYLVADPGDPSRPHEWADVLEADPDVLVAAPCGFELDQTMANLEDLTARESWTELTAVQEGRVYAMDGHGYVNRPGPRLVDTLDVLADLIHSGTADVPESVARDLPVSRSQLA
jgi:iron complex transport system substrate-binding protein